MNQREIVTQLRDLLALPERVVAFAVTVDEKGAVLVNCTYRPGKLDFPPIAQATPEK